jgi:predicted ATPase
MDLFNPFHGRQAELTLLADQLELADAGEARTVMIAGDTGSGRSALLAAFARDIAWKQRRVRAVLVRPPDTGRYDPVALAARDFDGRIARRMGRAPGTAARLLPDWIGTLPGVGNLLAATLATASAVRRHRARVTGVSDDVRRILRVARTRLLVLLIDDMERADGVALRQLQLLAQKAGTGHRLLIVTTHHADDAVRLERLQAALDDERTTRVALQRLPTARPIDLSVYGPELLAVLHAANALGESFDSLTLARILKRDELDVEDTLAVAVRKGVAVIDGEIALRDGESATRYRFTSASLRDALHQLPLARDIAV